MKKVCAVTLFNARWPMYSSLSMRFSYLGGRRDGRYRCSSSVWRRLTTSANASGDGQTIKQLWKEYFARLPKNKNGNKNSWPISTRGVRQPVQVDGASMHLESACTTSEAVAVLKNHVQQGITVDSYTYVEVLQRCFKQKDIVLAKQVHDCIRKSGMEQNIHVANNLLRVYIRCGRLQSARQVFDDLVKKCVYSWTIMIGGYVQHDYPEDAIEVFNQMCRAGVQPDAITYLTILKACASPIALKWGKDIHTHIRNGGFESDVRVGTALLNMYAKCGSIEEARQCFDKLSKRDVITWTVMISAYAESGCGYEAYELFLQMQQEGCLPNAFVYSSLLNQHASAGALEWVKDVHRHARKSGLETNLHVGNALVHMYAKSGSIDDARIVFDRMVDRDVITWNAMVGGLAEHGFAHEAFSFFLQMQRGGFVPNAITYLSILNVCASMGALEWVKEVHCHTLRAGLESDLCVGNALVHAYAKSGSIDDARLIFDGMVVRDVITWNTMIDGLARHGFVHEAYQLFLQMVQEGFVPDATTYGSILNPCASSGALEWLKEIHSHAIEAGLEMDVCVGTAFVRMYAKSGSIDDARLVFDRMVDRNVITWNVMIGGLAQHGFGHEAYQLFLQMEQEGFVPDATTYGSILNPCASTGALEWVKEVHRHSVRVGHESDVRVSNALIQMYAKSGSIDDAQLVFDRMEVRDIITWNTMIAGLAQHGFGHEAYSLFLQMQRGGYVPDAITYVSILNASASTGALEWVKEVHSHALKAGYESDLHVGSALVHMYARSGSIDDARLVFNRMVDRDVIAWNLMISGLAQHGLGHEALQIYEQMKAEGVQPNECTFVAVLSACGHAGLVDEGRGHFLAMAQEYGIKPSLQSYTCMVDLLGRAGHLEEAKLFIFDMPLEPDGATWGALLGACRTYGNVELAELAAKERLKSEPKDASTYVLLSNIYAAADKWDEVSLVRSTMQGLGIRKESGSSWIEIDHKIHHFVVRDTSHPEAKEIYAELNILTEKLKAEGYIPDTRLVLHNINEEDKELALCSHSEKLAITYGLMCTPPGTPIRIYKNLRVCSDCHTATKFITKVTGREIVAKDANRFHHFKDGVCSCRDYW